jgi:predicted DNA-binding transcriptional regulator YafY
LTDNEFAVLVLAASVSFLSNSARFRPVVCQAVHKLMGQLGQDLPSEMANLLKACVAVPCRSCLDDIDEQHGLVLEQLLLAIRKRRCVQIDYCQANRPEVREQTKLSPYRLVFANGCHVTGQSAIHRQVRSFDLNTIVKAELTNDSYTVPLGYLRPLYNRTLDDFPAYQGSTQE